MPTTVSVLLFYAAAVSVHTMRVFSFLFFSVVCIFVGHSIWLMAVHP